MIGQDMKYLKFHYLGSCKIRIGDVGFGYFYHPVKTALAI